MNTEKSKHKMSSVKDFKYLSIIMCAFIFQAGCDSKPKPPISAEDKALSELKEKVRRYEWDPNTKVVDWDMERNTNSVRSPFKATIQIETETDKGTESRLETLEYRDSDAAGKWMWCYVNIELL